MSSTGDPQHYVVMGRVLPSESYVREPGNRLQFTHDEAHRLDLVGKSLISAHGKIPGTELPCGRVVEQYDLPDGSIGVKALIDLSTLEGRVARRLISNDTFTSLSLTHDPNSGTNVPVDIGIVGTPGRPGSDIWFAYDSTMSGATTAKPNGDAQKEGAATPITQASGTTAAATTAGDAPEQKAEGEGEMISVPKENFESMLELVKRYQLHKAAKEERKNEESDDVPGVSGQKRPAVESPMEVDEDFSKMNPQAFAQMLTAFNRMRGENDNYRSRDDRMRASHMERGKQSAQAMVATIRELVPSFREGDAHDIMEMLVTAAKYLPIDKLSDANRSMDQLVMAGRYEMEHARDAEATRKRTRWNAAEQSDEVLLTRVGSTIAGGDASQFASESARFESSPATAVSSSSSELHTETMQRLMAGMGSNPR